MKIKMLTSMSGPDVQRSRGDVIEVSGDEATRLVEAGFAELVRSEPSDRAVRHGATEKAVK